MRRRVAMKIRTMKRTKMGTMLAPEVWAALAVLPIISLSRAMRWHEELLGTSSSVVRILQ
jgi:hypothetical protein